MIFGYGFEINNNNVLFNSMDIKPSGYMSLDYARENAKRKIDEIIDGIVFKEIRT